MQDDDPRREPLAAEGKRYIVREHISSFVLLAIALGAARTLGWRNAWVYAGLILLVKMSTAIVVTRVNPAVLNARGTRREMSSRERWFFAVFIPAGLAVPIVAGLDVGDVGWTHRSTPELAIGITLALLGAGFIIWALAANAFFETTVRVQGDRDHAVCTSGPYRFVRHPGYAGAIIGGAGVPMVLGSLWAFVPFAVTSVALIVRTAYEDRMLRDELEGYESFAARTRYRLLPFVW